MKKKIWKKLMSVVLCGAMVFSMAGCGNTGGTNSSSEADSSAKTSSEKTDSKKTTVGFIFVGAKDDYGYNQAAYNASVAVEKHFGDHIQVLRQENVPETEEASRALEQMIQKGATVLFPTSYGHLEPAMDVAKKYPDATFFHQGGLKTMDNLGTYFGTIWQSFYLCGIAAGANTKSNKLGFVASFPIPQVLANINAFELGAKSVNPDATTSVIFTGSWSDPALQTSSANTLIDKGIDVIAQHQDSTKTIVELCEQKGVYCVGDHADASELAPNTWLTGAVWHWDDLFIDMVQTAIDGKFDGSKYDGKYRGGLKEGVVDIAPFGKSVSEDTQKKIEEEKDKMINDDYNPFSDEIKDQKGNIVCKKGQTLTIDEIESMDYLVDGVIGSTK